MGPMKEPRKFLGGHGHPGHPVELPLSLHMTVNCFLAGFLLRTVYRSSMKIFFVTLFTFPFFVTPSTFSVARMILFKLLIPFYAFE